MNWSEARILFHYPSKSRPVNFRRGLESIINNLERPDLAMFSIVLDADDTKLSEYESILVEFSQQFTGTQIYIGTSKNKIDAVNRNLDRTDFEIIICFSDDMVFTQQGFDDIIRKDFADNFPDGDGVLHYPDQNQGEACMTMNITDRIYFNRFGYIYHPDYESVECDLENQEVAQMLGRYKYAGKRIFDHLHPSFGQATYDAQYNKTEDGQVHNQDKATRRRRKANNYDLVKVGDVWQTVTSKTAVERVQPLPCVPPIGVVDRLDQLAENAEKTKKLRGKLLNKISDCEKLASEIESLGLVKMSINLVEESVK